MAPPTRPFTAFSLSLFFTTLLMAPPTRPFTAFSLSLFFFALLSSLPLMLSCLLSSAEALKFLLLFLFSFTAFFSSLGFSFILFIGRFFSNMGLLNFLNVANLLDTFGLLVFALPMLLFVATVFEFFLSCRILFKLLIKPLEPLGTFFLDSSLIRFSSCLPSAIS